MLGELVLPGAQGWLLSVDIKLTTTINNINIRNIFVKTCCQVLAQVQIILFDGWSLAESLNGGDRQVLIGGN